MATEVKVRTGEVELRTCKLSKSILKQMPPVEQFRADYLPGGKEAQDEKYSIIGWVHGSVLESDEMYWKWLIVQLRVGEFVRIRVCDEDILRRGKGMWKQTYVV